MGRSRVATRAVEQRVAGRRRDRRCGDGCSSTPVVSTSSTTEASGNGGWPPVTRLSRAFPRACSTQPSELCSWSSQSEEVCGLARQLGAQPGLGHADSAKCPCHWRASSSGEQGSRWATPEVGSLESSLLDSHLPGTSGSQSFALQAGGRGFDSHRLHHQSPR
jgi:hypothetical protein